MKTEKQKTGLSGEDLAARVLKESGYRIIERNFRTIFGEIDIIAIENNDLVFIEVKNRQNRSFGSPQASVNNIKQKHLIKSAVSYIKIKNIQNRNLRFDVFAISKKSHEIIKNAFSPDSIYSY